jgi:DNA sulfur modification protein DndC
VVVDALGRADSGPTVGELDLTRGPTAQKIIDAGAVLRSEYLAAHDHPWIVGYSGGKDSTLLLQFVVEMLLSLPRSERRRAVHVVSNDTLVESPLVADYVDKMLSRLADATESLELPVVVAKTTPPVEQTFWVNLIGRGYPAPNSMFRWCTDRMKIQPTSHYIRSRVAEAGDVVLLLGVRRNESAKRAASANKYDLTGERLNPHNDLPGCWVFRPILDFTTEEVWQVLLQRRPPWGGTHRDVITLYRNAGGGECPLVIDKDSAASCGTSSSRFGCWTCTVVEKDRSMEGFIEAGHEEMEPLLEFRDWLASFRNQHENRMMERRNGQVTYMASGQPVPGPFTFAARRELLSRVLELQDLTGRPLISVDEIEHIKRIWAEDAVTHARRRAVHLPLAPGSDQ